MRWSLAAFGLCVVGSATVTGRAYELRVPSSPCGSEPELRSRVAERLSRAPGTDWSFTVEISRAETGIRARITSASPTGAVESRTVQGTRCDSVMDAAALVIAVTLDPTLGPPTPPSHPVGERRETATSRDARDAGSAHRATGSPLVSGPRREDWAFGLRTSAGARTAVSDTLALEVGAGAIVRRRAGITTDLSLEYVRSSGRVSNSTSEAELVLNAGRLQLMPVQLRLSRVVALEPGAGLTLGYLRGVPRRLPEGRSAGGLWVSVDVDLPLALHLSEFDLRLGPCVMVPLKRDSFEARGDTLHRVPAVEGGARIALTLWIE